MILQENGNEYCVQGRSQTVSYKGLFFYRIGDNDFIAKIFMLLASAINFNEVYKQMKINSAVNPDGFGKGFVYKNFDLSKKIILS